MAAFLKLAFEDKFKADKTPLNLQNQQMKPSSPTHNNYLS